jgi:hypothetical protein
MVLFLASCDESELLYNTSQKHTIYFDKEKIAPEVNSFTFAYYTFSDTVIDIPVRYMGMPVDKEQTFKVKVVADTIGVMPTEGEDYEYINLSFAPGEVATNLRIHLNRTEILKDTTLGISLVFEENEIFTPEKGTFFKLQVSDGELPMPTWWPQSSKKQNNRFLGNYYPEKYLMILEKFKSLEHKYPDFYKYAVENFGEFLHEIPADASGPVRMFYYFKYSSIWGRYVFQPVWDYYTDPANVLPGDDPSIMDDPVYLYK